MSRNGRGRGFALLELTVSILVLTVAIVGLLAALTSSSRLDTQSREKLLATNAARHWMSRLAVWPHRFLSDYNGHAFDVPGLQAQAGGALPGRISVRSLSPDLAEVEVRVSWRGMLGSGSLVFKTLQADTQPRAGALFR